MTDDSNFTRRLPVSFQLYGRIMCDACPKRAEVHIIATRIDNGESKTINVCKDHLLDPGPLLDYGPASV